MERELGISYPTVRGRVDALVRALGLAEGDSPEPMAEVEDQAGTAEPAPDDEQRGEQRREILERLARREIGAEDAAAALRELGGS
jgi:hypothetical protein